MRRLIRALKRIKIRHYISTGILCGAAVATPVAVVAARNLRGYDGFGGECLIFPLGYALSYLICQVAEQWESVQRHRRRQKPLPILRPQGRTSPFWERSKAASLDVKLEVKGCGR